jgi:O-antigen ligase
MQPRTRVSRFPRVSLSFALLATFLILLWLAGGASREDVIGQAIVRGAAWLTLIGIALFGPRPDWHAIRPVALLLMAALLIVLLQLIPLPPSIWQALPGRAVLADATSSASQLPWRPIAIVPGAAWNAASSLVVPATILLLAAGLDTREQSWVLTLLLALVALSALMGLLQFSGARFDNPFVNETPGQVSGTFANRNHFALLLAMGCVLAPVWAFFEGRRSQWRGPVAVGLILLFALVILASGSRAGMILGILALGMGLLLAWRPLRRELRRYPAWTMPVLLGAIVVMIGGAILLSVASDRALAITRVIATEGDEDMRTRALPTVWTMVQTYFPAGSGFGGFDPMFRLHEPYTLLKPTYFNHAHNDFIEIVLDGGLAGLLLLGAAIIWWLIATIRSWRRNEDASLARVGSVLLLLVFVASAFDYPARTPMMMAICILAGTWLARKEKRPVGSALPEESQQL